MLSSNHRESSNLLCKQILVSSRIPIVPFQLQIYLLLSLPYLLENV
uniref:Uncharacterized protein n=1 Tax=Picea glauca TaxID=3330 RepID=A0A101LVA8_PICGL|nr:hypothetical protein ABT39_MTgene2103 [Picea glauca]